MLASTYDRRQRARLAPVTLLLRVIMLFQYAFCVSMVTVLGGHAWTLDADRRGRKMCDNIFCNKWGSMDRVRCFSLFGFTMSNEAQVIAV